MVAPPLVPKDIARLRLITDVQISPDGQWVAYVVKRPDLAADRYRSTIFISAVDGGDAWPVTDGRQSDVTPRWSPDGQRLAFLSDRGDPGSGAPFNLYCIDMRFGGDARRLTDFADDVSTELTYPIISEAYAWSPSGRELCVSVKDPDEQPGAARPAYVYERLRYKSGENGWWDGRRRHLWLVDAGGGPPRRLTEGDWDAFGPTFSPDGRWIAFSSCRAFGDAVTNTLPDSNPFAGQDVWAVDRAGSAHPWMLTDADGPNMTPSFSPDGELIAYFGHREGVVGWAQNIHLWVRAAAGGEPRDLLERWDHTAGSHVMSDVHDVLAPPPAAWSADGRTLYFLGTVRGAANLFAVELASSAVRSVTRGDHELQTVSLSADRARFAALVSDGSAPAEVHVGTVADGELRRLTEVNAELVQSVSLGSVERTAVTVGERSIDTFVLRPPARQPPPGGAPMVLQIFPSFAHGRAFNFEHQMLASLGYMVVYANPLGATSYGETFLAGSYVRGEYFTDLHELLGVVDAICEREAVDPGRLGVAGDAYGGMMINWLVGETDRFKAAVSRRGVGRFWPPSGDRLRGLNPSAPDVYANPGELLAKSPITRAARMRTPLLLMHSIFCCRDGSLDGEELFAAVRAHGHVVRLVLMRSAHHFMVRTAPPSERIEFFEHVRAWFGEHLGEPDGA